MKTPYFNTEKRYAVSMMIALFLILSSNTSSAKDITGSLDLDISLPTSLYSEDSNLGSRHEFEGYLNKTNDSVNIKLVSFSQSSKNFLKEIQDRFLTIHYGKAEKIKAVYAHGGYGIAYQQEW